MLLVSAFIQLAAKRKRLLGDKALSNRAQILLILGNERNPQ